MIDVARRSHSRDNMTSDKKGVPMDIGWKLVSAGAGIVSGIIANKAVDVVWKSVSGRARPEEDDFSEALRTALVFSVVSAAVGAVVNELVMRRAARWYGLGDAAGKGVAEGLKKGSSASK